MPGYYVAEMTQKYGASTYVPLGKPVGVASSPFVGVEERTTVRRVIWVGVVRRSPQRGQRNLFGVDDRLAQTVTVPGRTSQALGSAGLSRQHGSHFTSTLQDCRRSSRLSLSLSLSLSVCL